MKILFCIQCLSYGGAEKNLCLVANHMAEKGHSVKVCSISSEKSVQPFRGDIGIIYMPEYHGRIVGRLKQLNYLKKLIKAEAPDAVVSFLTYTNFLSAIAGKLMKVPVIVSERGDPYSVVSRLSKWMHSKFYLASGAVFQTEMAKAYFQESLQKKSVVIPNPVLLKGDIPVVDYASAEKSIAYSARFEVIQKRQDIMLEAFKIVVEKHPEYILKFFGDGPDEDKMKDYAQKLGIAENVSFCGKSSKVLEDISHSELFVLSSDYEGIPNSLLEAMSIGMPCVSTDCSPGGARMLINDGENGLIVPCRNPKALSEAICRMIENQDFAKKCGKKAREVKERFSVEKTLGQWEKYITDVALKNN